MLIELFDKSETAEMEKLIKANTDLNSYDLRNKNGTFGKAKLKAALKQAGDDATMPEIYMEEYSDSLVYQTKMTEKEEADKAVKEAQRSLDDLVQAKYGELTIKEIKHLLFDRKWMARLNNDVTDAIDQVLNDLASRVVLIAKRYEHTLSEIEEKTAKSKDKVKAALERMGYKW